MQVDRRGFLKVAGIAGAATLMPRWVSLAASRPAVIEAAADLTTLTRTIVKGAEIGAGSRGAYHKLTWGDGEQHQLRTDLAEPQPGHNRDFEAKDSLLNFAHFTDIHVIDAQSPARVEFLDRYSDPGNGCESIPFSSAHRPQEIMTLQVLDAMCRRLREVKVSPLTGREIQSVVCTGDNIDNEQLNELRWFIDTMDGAKTVSVNSGAEDYEGVQSAEWADPEYWHPEPGVDDKYKQQWGFPEYPGLLSDALKPFDAKGVGVPWFQTFGNHDGLLQGNAGRNPVFEAVAVGPVKVRGLSPGVNPCDSFETLRSNPAAILAGPAAPVTADPKRTVVSRSQYIEEMWKSTSSPPGHGLTERNRLDGTAYWHNDEHDAFRFIGLDTVNPGGYSEGSIGAAQLGWLEEKLIEVSSRYFDADGNEVVQNVPDRLVILFSHHGLRSLSNPAIVPDPLEPGANDLPRMTAEEVEAVVARFPNVIAWVNGHTHENIIEPRQSPHGGGFWDIGTAAHIDWSCQSRLIEVLDNRDGTLSIFTTMIDHAAGPAPANEADPVLRLASISRELAANDFQVAAYPGHGRVEDRNTELLIEAPFQMSTLRKRRRKAAAAH